MLSAFHALNLRFVPGKTCKDRITNEDLFKATGSGSLSSGLNFFRPRWAGHVHRMPRHHIPCVILYGVLKDGTRPVGRPRRQYKDVLKRDLTISPYNQKHGHQYQRAENWRHVLHCGRNQDAENNVLKLKERRQRTSITHNKTNSAIIRHQKPTSFFGQEDLL